MKNVVYNTKKKWIGTFDGTIIGDSGGGIGSGLCLDSTLANASFDDSSEATEADGNLALRLLSEEDCYYCGEAGDNSCLTIDIGYVLFGSGRQWLNNADGILRAWKDCIYAETVE